LIKRLLTLILTLVLFACNSAPMGPTPTERRENTDLGVLQASLQGPSPITIPTKFMAGDTANGVTVEDTEVEFPRMFALDETEVTVNQYDGCVSAGECVEPGTYTDCNWGVSGRDDHPVNCVTYAQAVVYCTWAGKRLPTRHEWEYAARYPDGRMYPWGNSTSGYATKTNTDSGDSYTTTAPVGSFPDGNSYLGLKDMAGNVYEWTQTARCIWETGPCTNCPSNETCDNACDVCGYNNRAIKGGSYGHALSNTKSAGSADGDPSGVGDGPTVGFRCAVTIR
jgi:formylglycine-generating enzyme required for sulfatase activity